MELAGFQLLCISRLVHASFHLLLPDLVLQETTGDFCKPLTKADGSATPNRDPLCHYAASIILYGAVAELAFVGILWSNISDIPKRTQLLAFFSLIILIIQSWTALGSDLDISTSMEVAFSRWFALAAIIFSAFVNSFNNNKSNITSNSKNDSQSMLMYTSEAYYILICLYRFAINVSSACEPLEGSNIMKVSDSIWEKPQKWILARLYSLTAVNLMILSLCLIFIPQSKRVNYQGYLILFSTDAVAFILDLQLEPILPKQLLIENEIKGRVVFFALYCVGLIIHTLDVRLLKIANNEQEEHGKINKKE